MEVEKLRELLKKPEGPTLEFKQELHIYGEDPKAVKRNKDELIRDILSLANSTAEAADETKYLIIGAEDKQNTDGSRNLFSIGDKYPTSGYLLVLLRGACNPTVDTISVSPVIIDGKRLLVITIRPTLYVHETTRELRTPRKDYQEYTVFTRHDENIVIASASERAAIHRAKEKYFNERDDVPPVEFGAGIGGILVGLVGRSVAQKQLKLGAAGQAGAAFVTGLAGASMGAMMGKSYKDWRYIKNEWQDLPAIGRIIFISTMIPIMVILRWIIDKILRQLQKLNR